MTEKGREKGEKHGDGEGNFWPRVNREILRRMKSSEWRSIKGDFSFGGTTDRRFAYSRQPSFHQSPQSAAAAVQEPHTPIPIPHSTKPFLSKTTLSIDIPPPNIYAYDKIESFSEESKGLDEKLSIFSFLLFIFKSARSGNKQIRKLFVLISLNVAYSSVELCIGLFSGCVGLVSVAFHLTFGGLLTFSLFVMATSCTKPDLCYTYGLLSRQEIQAVVDKGCPNVFRKAMNSAKRLRAYLELDEGDVCSACNLRGSCDRAYVTLKEFEATARTVDIVCILLLYALDPLVIDRGVKTEDKEIMEISARNLLCELTEISDTVPAPDPPEPAVKVSPSKKKSLSFVELEDSQDVEMKRGDWICSQLTQLEQDIQRARAQGFFLGGGGAPSGTSAM